MQVFASTMSRRALSVVAAVASTATMLVAGQAAVAVTDASAATYCGAFQDAGARTSSRYGRVRTQACIEDSGNNTRAVNRTVVDKPSGCTWGASPSGPSTTCPPSAASLWPEFHGFQLDVTHDGSGIYRCSWGSNGGHALEFNCYSPWKAGRGYHSSRAQTCFDVKDDGAPWYCTAWATFSRTF
jgi:hypothetical protein